MNRSRKITIVFADQKLKKAFDDLEKGKGAEPQLYEFINRAFDDLEKNPNIGMKIPRKL